MLYNLSDIFPACYQTIIERKGKPKELALTSLPSIDNLIWGFNKQKLNIIGGRPSNGKSVLMLQLAWDFANQGKKVLFFSLEMTKQTIVERIISKELKIDNKTIRRGDFNHAQYQEKLTDIQEKLNNISFVLSDTMGKTFEDIFNTIETIKTDIDVVFIDYIQMVKNTGKTKKEAIDEYIKKLREYAIKKNFCAIIASQINRGTYNTSQVTPPNLWELKSSGDLEEHCDLAMLLHYPHHYDCEENEKEFKINIAKNRDGVTGNFTYTFEAPFSLIRETEVQDGIFR